MTTSDDDLIDFFRTAYAAALELPQELVAPDADLEAEFGLDSLQHAIVLAGAEESLEVRLLRAESPATITVRAVARMAKDAGHSPESA